MIPMPTAVPLSAELGTTTSNGSLTLNADGSFSYTPNAGFWGTDSFTYTATDGHAISNAGHGDYHRLFRPGCQCRYAYTVIDGQHT